MDMNIAAWMISGGPRIETRADEREREQLHVLLESRRVARPARPSLVARVLAFVRPTAPGANPA